jgi:hypothetical protein
MDNFTNQQGEINMGFFSKTCAKTHLPVCTMYKERPFFSAVVALTADGQIIDGVYDGYGRVNEVELHDDWDNVKFVLKHAYKGEKYAELGESHDEKAQGYFMADEFLDVCEKKQAFKSFNEYRKYFEKYAQW